MFPKDHLINIIVSPLTATYLQPPIFLEDSPYIDSWINRVFSHDVTAAILVSQASSVGVELFSYANAIFCPNKFA